MLYIFCSCGEDRTYEYNEKTIACHDMQMLMAEWYLWGDSIEDLAWKDYFANPNDFISKLTAMSPDGDSWSYCMIDTVESDGNPCGYFNHVNSYGIDVMLMTDPTGETTKQFARVVTVYANSPAERCGLQRNDFIAQVDNNKMASTVVANLVNGSSHTLVINRLGVNSIEESYYWSSVDTVNIEKSEKVSVDPVLVNKIVASGVGYLMLSNMTDTTSVIGALKTLTEEQPSALIIDLRLCNEGTIECAYEMAKLLGNARGTFLQTIWNTNKSANNVLYSINASSAYDLFFITSSYTQGAAEWLIYGLRSMGQTNMKVVGETTAGQNVMLKAIPTDYKYTIYPAVAYVADKDGNHDYSSGITPDEVINEFGYSQLYPYGDIHEIMLNAILQNY